jgi:hypothetical protein
LSTLNLGEGVAASKYRGTFFVLVKVLSQDATQLVTENNEVLHVLLRNLVFFLFFLD